MQIGTATMEMDVEGPQKVRDMPLDPAVLFSGAYSDDSMFYDRDTCLSVTIAVMLSTAGTVNNLDAHQHFKK